MLLISFHSHLSLLEITTKGLHSLLEIHSTWPRSNDTGSSDSLSVLLSLKQDLARETESDGVFDMLIADTLITQVSNGGSRADLDI